MLKLDQANLTALMRKRDLYIRLEKWSEGLKIQQRLMKANLSEHDQRGEASLLVGLVPVLPWLAHASWHAYRDCIAPAQAEA